MSIVEALAPRAEVRSPAPEGARRLIRHEAFVAGRWRAADGGGTIAVTDPATGDLIGVAPAMGAAETIEAIDKAATVQVGWADMTASERATPLHRWAELMGQAREDLAGLLSLEQGKPLAEARGEIDYGRGFLTWFAEEGPRQYGEIIPTHIPGRQLIARWAPIGVAAAITPWNFPSAMVTRKVGAALMAGCAVVLRPASETPYSALALAALAQEAGIPDGLFSVVTGDPEPIAEALLADPRIRKLSFTGSTRVGSLLMAGAAATLKKLSMELGGHAPFIVFEDVDLDVAVAAALDAKFQTSGQDCLAANRILVQRTIYPAFCDRLAAAAAALKVGGAFETCVQIGPLIGPAAVRKCLEHVADALAGGARLLTGGGVHPKGPNFFAPTVLADVTPQMRIFHEETFGPVAAIMPFDGEAEAVRLANDSEFGLAGYCFSRDLDRGWRVADALDCGMVAVNTVKMTGPPIPFGGVRQSGLGREGSRHGLNEYSELKYICINREPAAPAGDLP